MEIQGMVPGVKSMLLTWNSRHAWWLVFEVSMVPEIRGIAPGFLDTQPGTSRHDSNLGLGHTCLRDSSLRMS